MKKFLAAAVVCLLISGVSLIYATDHYQDCADESGWYVQDECGIGEPPSGCSGCGGCLNWFNDDLDDGVYDFGVTYEGSPRTEYFWIEAGPNISAHHLNGICYDDYGVSPAYYYSDDWTVEISESLPLGMHKRDYVCVKITFDPDYTGNLNRFRSAHVIFWYSQDGFPSSCWSCEIWVEGEAKPGGLGQP